MSSSKAIYKQLDRNAAARSNRRSSHHQFDYEELSLHPVVAAAGTVRINYNYCILEQLYFIGDVPSGDVISFSFPEDGICISQKEFML
jgi:hypothetical protein